MHSRSTSQDAWAAPRFGVAAAPYVTAALAPTAAAVARAYFPTGVWASQHSNLAAWPYLEACLYNASYVRPDAWVPSAPLARSVRRLLAPAPLDLALLEADQDAAAAQVAGALAALRRGRAAFDTPHGFAALEGLLNATADGLAVLRSAHLATFSAQAVVACCAAPGPPGGRCAGATAGFLPGDAAALLQSAQAHVGALRAAAARGLPWPVRAADIGVVVASVTTRIASIDPACYQDATTPPF